MNWPEILQKVMDQAVGTFGAITEVTAIEPIQLVSNTLGAAADFNYLAPVANHIFYINNISILETTTIVSNPMIEAYDLTPTAFRICYPGIGAGVLYNAENFFCTRLAHLKNGGSAGAYSIIFTGFDLTYI